jgi:hypothetical protein
MCDRRLAPTASCLLASLILVLGAGCGPTATHPKTYSVKGTVVYKDGQPLAGGVVEFRSTKDPMVRATGTVGPDGTFTLFTPTQKDSIAGAEEGEYSVNIIPRMEGDQTAGPPQIQISGKKTYTIKPDDPNEITITVDRPKKGP